LNLRIGVKESCMQWKSVSRKRCSPGVWIAAAAMAALILGSSGGPTPFYPMNVRSGRHGLARIRGQRSDGAWESENWSGYAIAATSGSLPSGSVTLVRASWIVPKATCTGSSEGATNGYASFWVGIDGWSSDTVEQIGTDSDCVSPATGAGNTPSYYAWFEFYPQAGYYIGNPSNSFKGYSVESGDTITAGVNANGNGNFTVIIQDTRHGVVQWTFSTTGQVPGALQSSAQWIAESPCCLSSGAFLPLSNFGFTDYGNEFTGTEPSMATVQGVTGAIGSFGQNIQQSTMVSQGAPGGSPAGTFMAQPSSLMANGTSFSIQWLNSGP
jgi:Peptidase A4 family